MTRSSIASLLLVGAVFMVAACASRPPLAEDRDGFATPEAAVESLLGAMRSGDVAALGRLLGPAATDLLDSGDAVADADGRSRFVGRYDAAHRLERAGGEATLLIGAEEWPVPIPIVEENGSWFFDTDAGADELVNRRIGRNELGTIQACLAVSDAQREYAATDWDGDGVFAYAQKLKSSAGHRDGLYWESNSGQPPSPVGALAARASARGYSMDRSPDSPEPYQGYYYRLLRCQGENASGGAYDYMAGKRMIGGFALIAYPADYANSGIMSFMVSHEGVVYEADLGDDTAAVATKIESFDPDDSWSAVTEEDLAPVK